MEEKLSATLLSLELELRKAAEIAGLTHIISAIEEVRTYAFLLFLLRIKYSEAYAHVH
jgi:hypothetical protein